MLGTNGTGGLDQAVVAMPSISDWLVSCADSVVSGESAIPIARTIAPQLRKRHAINVLSEAIDALRMEDTELDAVVSSVLQTLDTGQNDTVLSAKDAFERGLDLLNKKVSGQLRGFPTGINSLDDLLGNLWPGDLCVIAGRPGMGKTAFAMTAAMSMAISGHPVALFSLEMTAEQLIWRAMSSLSGIPFWAIHRGNLSQEELAKISGAADFFNSLPLYILPSSSPTIYDIRRESVRLVRRHNIRAIFVDYLQRVAPPTHLRNQIDAAVGATCKVAKSIARDTNTCVVMLAQLNRLSEHREDKRPSLHNLRDSGNIEQEADSVVFIYRDAYYRLNNDPQVELIVGKNRHGATGIAKAYFDSDHMVFTNQPV